MGRLTTHVLDTARGRPAAGMQVDLYRLDGEGRRHVAGAVTNADGRCDAALLADADFRPGRYQLVFQAGRYFAATDQPIADPPFLDEITLAFGIAEADGKYHVPLLVSPWSYATYRGS